MFYCIIDIAGVYCFILFQQHRKNNSDLMTLKQHSLHSVLNFIEELIRSIIGLENILNLLPLAFINLLKIVLQSTFHNFLIKKGIKMYAIVKIKKKLKVYSYCFALQYDVFLHCIKDILLLLLLLLSRTMQNIIEKLKNRC